MQQSGGSQFNEWTVDWRPEPSAASSIGKAVAGTVAAVTPELVKDYKDNGIVCLPGACRIA